MKKSPVAIIVFAVIIFGGGLAYWYAQTGPSASPAAGSAAAAGGSEAQSSSVPSSSAPHIANVPATSDAGAPAEAAITYTNNGFSPANITVAQGATVIFQNNSSNAFWPASNVHPLHTLYDGTTLQEHCANPTAATFDACGPIQPGASWSFTFEKAGTWGFHNHLNPSEGGTVTVR